MISPTFVLARIHRPVGDGPALVHVDAYRLGGFAELEDIDLEASLADSVTLVEWGTGVAETPGVRPVGDRHPARSGPRGRDPLGVRDPAGPAGWDHAALAAALKEEA